jgi:excinuclease ABC subunit A
VPPKHPICPSDLFVEGARQNNLKNISLRIPHNAVTAITGVSGSGKSSLAFDTLFAEGQWRYVESLSTYARMFIERADRPDVDRLINIRPAIAIEQKNTVRSARSTIGTATEIADLLRLLFAKIGHPICPDCGEEARRYHAGNVVDDLLGRFSAARATILFPIKDPGPGDLRTVVDSLLARGFIRLQCDDAVLTLEPGISLPRPAGSRFYVVLDRLVLRPDNRQRLIEAVETAYAEGDGSCCVNVIDHGLQTYSARFQCQRCERGFEPFRPASFSFNHPLGACQECKGFGNILRYDEALIIPDPSRSLVEGAVEPWTKPGSDWWQKQMLVGMKRHHISLTTPYSKLSEGDRALLWTGDKTFEGINEYFQYLEGKRYKMHVRVLLSRYRSPVSCPACQGSRLNASARHVKVAGRDIHQISSLSILEVAAWLDALHLSEFEATVAHDILTQLKNKLRVLLRLRLEYLTLNRQTRTLSGGEFQRIMLGNQLGARLVGTLYVLDEPTIGLHARDTATLADILHDLARNGNTVVLVEHDARMISSADHVVEIGPWSGEKGGEVVCSTSGQMFLQDSRSLTARYLRGEESIPVPRMRRHGHEKHLVVVGARTHNLKNLTVTIPLGMLVCVTGVSGSGKSTLVEQVLHQATVRAFRGESLPISRVTAVKGLELLNGVRLIDQQPIGRSPRSNPATYLKIFDEIRHLFANEAEAGRQGLTAGSFSFNQPGGRCERCQGNGYEHLEMYFFEDIYVTCEDCEGRRFGRKVLNVRVRGKTIHNVLAMTMAEAQDFFSGSGSRRLLKILRLMSSIGLGHLRLGQSATTLSGGEAQRLKIVAEIKDPGAKDLLYILDEPTTGLHFHDVKNLLAMLGKLVDAGNTLVVVEHNLDFIKNADWVIDLGPEGGEGGGQIVAEGRPEQIAQTTSSYTGQFLKPFLKSAYKSENFG